MIILNILYFLLILGVIVLVHEFGHFIFAKKAGIYVYEFSLGMGPRLFKFKRNKKIKDKKTGKVKIVPDETEYSIRLLPIGGYVQLAGEEVELDKNIPEDKRIQSKTWLQRFLTMIAGVMFNFLLAIIILFIIALVNGVSLDTRFVTKVNKDIYGTELVNGDKIIKINNKRVNNYDKLALEIQVTNFDKFKMTVLHKDKTKSVIEVNPVKKTDKKGNVKEVDLGFSITGKREKGIVPSIKYAFLKFFSSIEQMFFVILYLITGTLSLNMLSGPVGLFGVVSTAADNGLLSVLSLIALFSINVGFINILPLPAFDGGRALFLIVEKIKGSPVNQKVENIIHTIGFYLLMLLMIYITFNDVLKLF